MSKRFVYDTIIDEENICNLDEEKKRILAAIKAGKKLVIYGRRNTGKTSLIESVIIPAFQRQHKKCFVFSVDLMGVRTKEDIDKRVKLGFETSMLKSFPVKKTLTSILESLSKIRPQMGIDPVSGPTITIGQNSDPAQPPAFESILAEVNQMQKKIPTLVTLDEFQDVHFIKEGEALFRSTLQHFSRETPVLILGSKRHLLAQMFAAPNAPLAGYGEDLVFSEIDYEEYYQYMQERFTQRQQTISLEDSIYLQDLLQRIPEPINIICAKLMEILPQRHKIVPDDIHRALILTLEQRRERFVVFLSAFSTVEERILTTIAKMGIVNKPSGKEFLSRSKLSARGAQQAFKKLEDLAVIYHTKEGYIVADPLLDQFLKRYR